MSCFKVAVWSGELEGSGYTSIIIGMDISFYLNLFSRNLALLNIMLVLLYLIVFHVLSSDL